MSKEELSQVFVQMTGGAGIDGVITEETLLREFANAGIYVNEELLGDIFEYVTDNYDERVINFKQFNKLMESIRLDEGENPTRESYTPEVPSTEFNRAVKLGFQSFDRDEDNKIGPADLKESLVDHSYSRAAVTFENATELSPQDLSLLVYAVEKTGGDSISKQGLANAAQKHKDLFLSVQNE